MAEIYEVIFEFKGKVIVCVFTIKWQETTCREVEQKNVNSVSVFYERLNIYMRRFIYTILYIIFLILEALKHEIISRAILFKELLYCGYVKLFIDSAAE